MIFNSKVINSQHVFVILIVNLSYLCALDESNDFIADNISLSATLKEFLIVFVLYEKGGSTLVFFINVHIDEKWLLEIFAFTQKSEIKLTSSNRDGIAGISLL